VPAAAVLVAAVARPAHGGPACRIEVSARADDGAEVHGELGADRDRIELGAVGDRAVRLELTARGCARAELADPVITVAGPAPAPPPTGPPPRYVVLWVFDALRADRVRPFQPGARAEVPNFDKLAATSAVFRQFYVGGNESQVSHATVWTSSYPAVHDVRPVGDGGSWRLPRRLPVLGELVRAGGLTPIAVTGNGFVTSEGGYGRGFAEYRNMMKEKGIINGVLYGAEILAHGMARLEARKDEPLLPVHGHHRHPRAVDRAPAVDRSLLARLPRPVPVLRRRPRARHRPGQDGLLEDPGPARDRSAARDLRLGGQLPRRPARRSDRHPRAAGASTTRP
jgi:hypothetical protein